MTRIPADPPPGSPRPKVTTIRETNGGLFAVPLASAQPWRGILPQSPMRGRAVSAARCATLPSNNWTGQHSVMAAAGDLGRGGKWAARIGPDNAITRYSYRAALVNLACGDLPSCRKGGPLPAVRKADATRHPLSLPQPAYAGDFQLCRDILPESSAMLVQAPTRQRLQM